jgi:hypothetical protein
MAHEAHVGSQLRDLFEAHIAALYAPPFSTAEREALARRCEILAALHPLALEHLSLVASTLALIASRSPAGATGLGDWRQLLSDDGLHARLSSGAALRFTCQQARDAGKPSPVRS